MSLFVPSEHEVLALLEGHRLTRRITHYKLPLRQLHELRVPGAEHAKWTETTVVELLRVDAAQLRVYLRDVQSEQTAWERLGVLYLSEFVTATDPTLPLAATPSRDRRPLAIPVDVNADIRAREFAHLVRTHCTTCTGSHVATLDGRLRNAAHLVRHGVRPSSVLVVEKEPRVALFQRLLQIGTDVEEVRVELGNMQTFFLTKSREQLLQSLVAMNLDFCGSVPRWVTPGFCAQFQSVAIWGFTAGVRNNRRAARGMPLLPLVPGMTACRTYHHGQVDCVLLVKDRATCAETVPAFSQTYPILDIIARWVSTADNSDGPGRIYLLAVYRDADGVIQGDWFEDVELADEARELADAWGRRERAYYARNKHPARCDLLALPSTRLDLSPDDHVRIRSSADSRYGQTRTDIVVGHTKDGTLFVGQLSDSATIHLMEMESLLPLWTTPRRRRVYAAETPTRPSHLPHTVDRGCAYILRTFDEVPSHQYVHALVEDLERFAF